MATYESLLMNVEEKKCLFIVYKKKCLVKKKNTSIKHYFLIRWLRSKFLPRLEYAIYKSHLNPSSSF